MLPRVNLATVIVVAVCVGLWLTIMLAAIQWRAK